MKRIWAIFLRDIKNIGKNPVAVIVALGIMILPSLYAWFNIAANWDPYGNTKGLRVAVASLDQGTRIEQLDTTVNIGDMIISNLHENDQIGWQFVDEEGREGGPLLRLCHHSGGLQREDGQHLYVERSEADASVLCE